jgi:predicted ArsR family transcriptional regulator
MTEWAAKPRGAGLSADEFSAAVSAVTSAFGDPTRRDIYLFVRAGADGVTAAEVAERFDLHPNVARHHLEKLTAGGYLTVELARHETAGRPSKRYRPRQDAVELAFPARRDDLLITLLGRAIDLLPADVAQEMAEQVGEDYGRQLAEDMCSRWPP